MEATQADTDIATQRVTHARASDDPVTHVTVMGERSSGTNLCEALMAQNFGLAEPAARPWKHAPGTALLSVGRNQLVLICVREAVSWARSMYAKPWHASEEMTEGGFSAFLHRPWDSAIDAPRRFGLSNPNTWRGQPLLADRHPLTGACYRNLLEMRTVKARTWLALRQAGVNFSLVRLEDMQADPERELDRIAAEFALKRPRSYEIPTEDLGSGFWGDGKDERRAEVRSISDADRDFILSQLDPQVEAAMGYSYDAAASA